ncbi:hypothetical protein [Streptomyces sp. NPDC096132]|uniref:hypothetical protein n=1 Tax=Streptomyces sp. NPDC096132 TaxID=3366075 RepID=UPI0037F41791
MTDRPYTDEDLRAEAARQHTALTDDPDFMGVGEQMEGRRIPSTDDGLGGMGWDGLPNEHYDEARRKIHDLINSAANVSEWAIGLGADGLEPGGHSLTVGAADKPIARIHFAFEPGMPERMRIALVEGLGQFIANAL